MFARKIKEILVSLLTGLVNKIVMSLLLRKKLFNF